MSVRYFVSTHAEGRTAPVAIDTIREDGLSSMYGETQDAVALRYPNVVIMSSDELEIAVTDAFRSEPVVISEDKFIEMLGCLPPMKWCDRGHTESFMMSEFLTGRITGIYCRIGTVYFTFHDVCSLVHDQIVAKCLATRDALNLCVVTPGA